MSDWDWDFGGSDEYKRRMEATDFGTRFTTQGKSSAGVPVAWKWFIVFGSFFSERNSEPPPDRKERGATGQAPGDRQYGPDKTLTSPSDALSTGDVGAASKAAGAVVGAVITGVMAGSLLE